MEAIISSYKNGSKEDGKATLGDRTHHVGTEYRKLWYRKLLGTSRGIFKSKVVVSVTTAQPSSSSEKKICHFDAILRIRSPDPGNDIHFGYGFLKLISYREVDPW